jgi:hypothetical protein
MKKLALLLLPLGMLSDLARAVSDGGMWFVAATYLCVAQYPAYADLPVLQIDEGSRSMLREMGRLRPILLQCQRDRTLPLLPVALCDAIMAHQPTNRVDWDAAYDYGSLIRQRYESAIQRWLDCIPR